ncbi:MAG: outer membrane lipoprotein Slp family [Candidatus Jettenia ecosi]|uniref:Outer membrane lipoprotein Slp family n=1 Tax=Candidatus Jettenia ecosi TaxID=2494326 RepID=A0A533Q7A6_9BACT|nr:MAG: outer membrane lipoprotein Slp family [Candidatus Jettenia ecosi]
MIKDITYFSSYQCISFVILLLITGCAPVISKQVREQVNPNIRVEEVFKDPERYQGEMIIVSGNIIETENTKEGTFIKILQHPAGSRGRPKDVDTSKGRFLAAFDHYLDPVIYAKGRAITIAGEVQGKQTLPVGEVQYTYPVIRAKEMHLWPVEKRYYSPDYYYHDHFWWRRGFWYY